jgi:hypothetical protein
VIGVTADETVTESGWSAPRPSVPCSASRTTKTAASTSAARVTPATVRVHDTALDVEDWAEETVVV